MRQRTSGVSPRRRRGFSIMELIVVLLVISIIAAAAAPKFFASLQHHEIETAARRLALDLEQARHAARMKSQTQSLTFTGATTYTLSAGITSLRSASQAYSVNLAATPYNVDSVTVNLGGPTTISFDGYGNASVGGTIVLARGSQTRTVNLSQASGQIVITNP